MALMLGLVRIFNLTVLEDVWLAEELNELGQKFSDRSNLDGALFVYVSSTSCKIAFQTFYLLIFLSSSLLCCLKVPCIVYKGNCEFITVRCLNESLCAILNYQDEGLVACPEVTHLILGNDQNVSTVSTTFCNSCHTSKAFMTMLHISSYGITLLMIMMMVLGRACSSVWDASYIASEGAHIWCIKIKELHEEKTDHWYGVLIGTFQDVWQPAGRADYQPQGSLTPSRSLPIFC